MATLKGRWMVLRSEKHHRIVIKVAHMNHAWCKLSWHMPHYCLLASLMSNLVHCTHFLRCSWFGRDTITAFSLSGFFIAFLFRIWAVKWYQIWQRAIKWMLYELSGNVSLHRCASGMCALMLSQAWREWWTDFSIHIKDSFMLLL